MGHRTGSQYPVLGPKAIKARSWVTHKNREGACAATGEDLGPEVRRERGLEVETQLFSSSTEQDERGMLTLLQQKIRRFGYFLELIGNRQI